MTGGDLAGIHAVVTGGASGIGLAIARRLAAGGAVPVVLDREPADVQPGWLTYTADVTSADELQRVRDDLAKRGTTPRIVVANAGINVRQPALQLAMDDAERILRTNLLGAFATLTTFAPAALRAPGSRFIVTSSVSAFHGMALRAVYTATKGGLTAMIRSLAVEWGPSGATVNAVGPGIIQTPLLQTYMDEHPERVLAALDHTPVGRLGTPEDVAHAVGYLVSPEAGFVTGHTLIVDGGLTSGSSWW